MSYICVTFMAIGGQYGHLIIEVCPSNFLRFHLMSRVLWDPIEAATLYFIATPPQVAFVCDDSHR